MLKKRKSSLAEDLLCSVKNRIQQRRQHDMVNLIRYLQNPNLSINDKHYADDISLLGSNTKDGLVKSAATLFCRLFWKNDSNERQDQAENKDIELANDTNTNQEHESLFQRLQTHIEHSTNSTPTQLETFVDERSLVSQLQTVIKQERKLLEATGKRPSKLEQLLKALLTIPTTSVEAERAFSAAELFATKLRSRLSHKSVCALSFLRKHYMKNN